jgi:hypothetical protein
MNTDIKLILARTTRLLNVYNLSDKIDKKYKTHRYVLKDIIKALDYNAQTDRQTKKRYLD